ncbi:uncharacterized protein LOC141907918 isoform X1 [Tubulanus polymorphus]|uniref:uncharacterized protein LOC141907918 isoform X1 n=2 Tax=Tubulanus polymorphus TaxID=672921 RepID=UPI003DA42DFC
MMNTRSFLIIYTILLQLGNLNSAETSGNKTHNSMIYPKPVPDGKPDIKREGQTIEYICKTRVKYPTVIFQQKRRDSEQWETIPDELLRITRNVKHITSASLEFKADFKLHNGTTFRCLVLKEGQTDFDYLQFDLIVVHRTDLNQIPATEISKSGVRLLTAENVASKNKTGLDHKPDWTMMIIYIACGAIGFLLVIVIIVVIVICRRRLLPGEGRVEVATPQVLDVYDELYDDIDSVTVTDKLHTSDQKVTTDPYANIETGNDKDTTPYMDMAAAKGKDTPSYIDMEAGKGKDTTPYMDMGPGIEEDTYRSTETGKDKHTTPYMNTGAEKRKDRHSYVNTEAGKARHLKKDTDEPVKDDVELYSYATVQYTRNRR